MKPNILTDSEPSVIPAEWPVSEPTAEPGLPQPSATMLEQAVEPRRSTHMNAEPSWLKDYVTWKIEPSSKAGVSAILPDYGNHYAVDKYLQKTKVALSTG